MEANMGKLQKARSLNTALPKLLIVLVSLVLVSCSIGKITSEWVILPIEEGQSYTETYKDIDYTMVVNCHYKPGVSGGEGTLEFKGDMTPNRRLETLIINLNFLDAQGNILQTNPIYTSGIGGGAAPATISNTFTVPHGTSAIALTDISRERVRMGKSG
jgi:hypothetical protein